MENYIIALAGFLLLFILFAFGIIQKNDEAIETSKQLDNEITVKQKHLSHLEQQITNKTMDRTTNLSKTQIEVLDIYDNSNIRIPIDIIEDLTHMNLYEYQDIIEYIENQRYFWKLENTKKPFKRK